MWKIFEAKCVKLVSFCILQSFTYTDVNALSKKNILLREVPNKSPCTCTHIPTSLKIMNLSSDKPRLMPQVVPQESFFLSETLNISQTLKKKKNITIRFV